MGQSFCLHLFTPYSSPLLKTLTPHPVLPRIHPTPLVPTHPRPRRIDQREDLVLHIPLIMLVIAHIAYETDPIGVYVLRRPLPAYLTDELGFGEVVLTDDGYAVPPQGCLNLTEDVQVYIRRRPEVVLVAEGQVGPKHLG